MQQNIDEIFGKLMRGRPVQDKRARLNRRKAWVNVGRIKLKKYGIECIDCTHAVPNWMRVYKYNTICIYN